jgi:hypothetical protein
MVDEKALAQRSSRMNFDSGEEPAYMRYEPRQNGHFPHPESVSDAMKLPRMEARVGEKNFDYVQRGWITFEYRSNVSSETGKIGHQ